MNSIIVAEVIAFIGVVIADVHGFVPLRQTHICLNRCRKLRLTGSLGAPLRWAARLSNVITGSRFATHIST
jgi:hypothetical protein